MKTTRRGLFGILGSLVVSVATPLRLTPRRRSPKYVYATVHRDKTNEAQRLMAHIIENPFVYEGEYMLVGWTWRRGVADDRLVLKFMRMVVPYPEKIYPRGDFSGLDMQCPYSTS